MLGLKRGTVILVRHNSKWKSLFEKEKRLILKTFSKTILAIEHVGSTAIPGIPAKPILDINIGVRSLKIARSMKKKLEKLGYEHRPFVSGKTKDDLKWQELYVKGSESKRTHHAHVTVFGNDYWKNDLLFRDHLRQNPNRARQYSNLKKKLASKHFVNRAAYTKNKQKFILQSLKIAKKEFAAMVRQAHHGKVKSGRFYLRIPNLYKFGIRRKTCHRQRAGSCLH